MIKKTFVVQNKLGLHARASMKLVDLVSQFSSQVMMIKNNKHIDAKNILDVMAIGAHQGTELTFEVSGSDEKSTINAIEKLINTKFGEDGC